MTTVFQIPMRGNESRVARVVRPMLGEFQIPMRGNEFDLKGRRDVSSHVSNPHEG